MSWQEKLVKIEKDKWLSKEDIRIINLSLGTKLLKNVEVK